MVRLDSIADLADDFVRVRLVRITGVDLRLFEFDYDLTWFAFFMNADGTVYGRYGGRDATGPDSRISLAGLRHAMQAALAAHRAGAKGIPPPKDGKPEFVEEYPPAKRLGRNECIHCHQVNEFRREMQKAARSWQRDARWVYPLPENIGLTLDVDRGNVVRSVAPGSPAAKAGLQEGDLLTGINDYPVASFADAQYALHRSPAVGRVPITWQRGGDKRSGSLPLAPGWRTTNLTWRPSMLDVLPSLSLYGDELTAAEKEKLGLSPKRLAFRQQKDVPKEARDAGVQAGDIIIGIEGQVMEMSLDEFLAYVRRNYLVGDVIVLNMYRGGKKVDVSLRLK